jgi:hypothetical protein
MILFPLNMLSQKKITDQLTKDLTIELIYSLPSQI